MSAKYTFLAWDTPIENAPLKLALLQLANNADDGGFSYYSISKMANSCGMSERTFMRKISELEKMNVLTVERRSNRPSLYTLVGDEMGVTLCHLQESQVTDCHAEVTESHLVGDRESPVLNSTPNTTPNNTDNVQKDELSPFEFWWKIYPKKEAKITAKALFNKKIKGMDEHAIGVFMDNICKHSSHTYKGKQKEFIPMPTTYLNQERYNDE